MILRITQKLGKKIKFQPCESMPLDKNPYADWSAHLFTVHRVQYIILTNTASLYSVVMFGEGITNDNTFIKEALSYMELFMAEDGNGSIFERDIAHETLNVYFSKSINRSVTGSMNDLVSGAKLYLGDGDESPYQVSVRLNQTPMSYLSYDNPQKAFKNLKIQNIIPFPIKRSRPNLPKS